MKLELGTLRWTVEVKDGNLTLHMAVLQDNFAELRTHIPDGAYSWLMTMDVDKADKADEMPEEWRKSTYKGP
jgi:hypothetical protein